MKKKGSVISLRLKMDQQHALAVKRRFQPPGQHWESTTSRSGVVIIPLYSVSFLHFNMRERA